MRRRLREQNVYDDFMIFAGDTIRELEREMVRMIDKKTAGHLCWLVKKVTFAPVKIHSDGALTDVPRMLRGLATLIETDPAYKTEAVLVVRDVPGNVPPALHAYGDITAEDSLRMLVCGQHALVEMFTNGKGAVTRDPQ